MKKNISRIGGAQIGYGNSTAYGASWPFAYLKVTEDNILLMFLWNKYYFDKKNITYLKKYKGCILSGLQIVHDVKGCPTFIVFRTFNFDELKSQLEEWGYNFQE